MHCIGSEKKNYLDNEALNMRDFVLKCCRMGIRESAEWLVEVMERSKRTEMLRARAGAMGPGTA